MSHELHTYQNGTTTLKHRASGQLMHSKIGPRDEATLLYVEQSRLEDRLARRSETPLVLFDVGLGAGSNALAAVHARASGQCTRVSAIHARERVQKTTDRRPLHVISFENDLSGFELALRESSSFPFFDGLEPAARALLDKGQWLSDDGTIRWELRRGDFLAQLDSAPKPELIYFDFYAPDSAPELWGVEMFTRIRRHVDHATLFTYSAATRVRVALLLAGFFAGYGRATSAKLETTVASTDMLELERPLDARWLARLARSHDRVPHGLVKEEEAEMLAGVKRRQVFR